MEIRMAPARRRLVRRLAPPAVLGLVVLGLAIQIAAASAGSPGTATGGAGPAGAAATPAAQDPGGPGYPLTVLVAPTPTPEPPLATEPPLPSPITHPGDGSVNSCAKCHSAVNAKQKAIAEDWAASVHGKAGIGCADCHGGDPTSDSIGVAMDRSATFRGVPDRTQTIATCGACHSDVEKMRQYQLPTDQYTKYYSSVHGQQLLTARDTRVAICTDCHGVHDIKKASDPTAKAYMTNVPALCASCHADATKMQPYGIPTDQYDKYKKSIHGIQLLQEQDLRAPNCASCHGSHDAKPPNSTEVINVCGKCHTATQALFEQSRHAGVPAVGPRCWTCHGTHDVSLPDEKLLLHEGATPDFKCSLCHEPGTQQLKMQTTRFEDPADRRCDTCHHSNSDIYSQVTGIHDVLARASDAFTAAGDKIAAASKLGMIVGDAEVALTEAKTELIRARAAVHTTKLGTISDLADSATAKAQNAGRLADAQLDESTFRRQAMIVVLAIIGFNILLLVVFRRGLHPARR